MTILEVWECETILKPTFPELETVLVSLPICVLVLSSAAPAVEAFVFVESSIFPPTYVKM